MPRTTPALLWGLFPLTLLHIRPPSNLPAFADPAANERLEAADRQFEQKSYAEALEGYRHLLTSGVDLGDRRPEAEYRYAVSLGKAERWDEALQEADAFVSRHRATVWEARGQYWLGRLYVAVPHQGYKVGDRLYRGSDVPKTDAAEKAQQVWLLAEDMKRALAAFETAKGLFESVRRQESASGSSNRARFAEEVDLCFDLAWLLQGEPLTEWARARQWLPPSDPSWSIDPKAEYRSAWPVPKRVLFLFRQAEEIGSPHQGALARLAEALFLDRYQAMMPNVAQLWENGRARLRPYPYQDRDAEPILRSILADFPQDAIADQTQYTIGLRRARKGDLVGALDVLRALVRTSPRSKWASDARAQIAGILRRELSLDTGGPQPSGRRLRITLWARNVRHVDLRAYRIRLEEIVCDSNDLNDPNRTFSEIVPRYFVRHGEAALGAPVARWHLNPHNRGDYRGVQETASAPLDRPGAYFITADAGADASAAGRDSHSQGRITVTGLLLITDRILVQKVGRDGALLFDTNARNGAPEREARVLAREVYSLPGQSNHARTVTGQTNDDGLFEFSLTRGSAGESRNIEAIAWSGEQYAVSPQLWSGYYGSRSGFKLYSYTDRPVYRPGQTVHFRQLVTRQQNGRVTPLVGRGVKISVTDARGNTIHEATLTTDAFGAVAGEFPLAQEPPLGEYNLNAEVLNTTEAVEYGGNRFRVEEYKKPEFEVTVAPDKAALRVGEKGRARVKTRYYFGAPVPAARVVYHIYRSQASPSYRFPRPFDFLYRFWDQGDYDYGAYRGDLSASGEARTDAAGEAEIAFDTTANDPRWSGASMRYTIEAEVTDSSRRTITGSGAVMATRQQFFAFVDTPQGFYAKGDRVPVEIVTLDANEQPVAASGSLKVYRQQWRGDRVEETLVQEEPVKTEATGHAKVHWTAARTGSFQIAFEGLDAWEVKVVGSTTTWVAGAALARDTFLRQGVRLVMENDTVPEGSRARVLLITDEPGATVLLTQEANDEILRREVIHLEGNSRVIELPLNESHAPNFYLQATVVRAYDTYQATQEVRVPAVRRLVEVKVTADRERYRPGERASFRLIATDWRGQPVRGAFSVGIVDASLYAIQKEYAPDVRQYFYADRRSQSVQNTASTGIRWQLHVKDDQPSPSYPLHEWVVPEGMGQLEEWPGKQAMGYYGYPGWGFGGNSPAPADGRLAFNGAAAGGLGGFGGERGQGAFQPEEAQAAARVSTVSAQRRAGREDKKEAKDESDRAGALAPATVRSNFADTAFWTPSVVTDSQGTATVTFAWPDNLTTWRATTRGWTADAEVGTATAEVVTRKDLLVRLQAPRFFVERDLVTLTANVHNYLPRQKRVHLRLQLEGEGLELVQKSALTTGADNGRAAGVVRPAALREGGSANAEVPSETWIEVPKDGEARFDWAVHVRREGTVKVRMVAQTDEESDAVELSFPVIVHGVEKLIVTSGALLDGGRPSTGSGGGGAGVSTARFTIEVPKARKPGSSELNLQFTPSVAGTMLDALPYLADYPYGCIEQTMSRFLPSVVVAKSLQDLGLRLEELEKRANAYAAERKADAGSRPVSHSPYTYPKGMPGAINVAEQASSLWYHRLDRTPVFHAPMLREMVTTGLQRIVAAQNGDGGWGWWPGNESDPYMSACVLYGLLTTREAGWSVPEAVLGRAIEFVKHCYLQGDDLHRMADAAAVLSMDPASRDAIRLLLAGRLFERRERLSPYTKALLAMALQRVGEGEKAKIVLANLGTTAKVDAPNGTAHWEGSGEWWRWYENRVETSAAVLQAVLLIDPAHPLGDRPLAPMIVKWLVNNRRGQHWSSTRETAMAVYALANYVRVNRELAPEYSVTVDFDGRQKRTYQVNAANVLFFDNRFIVPDALLHDGVQTVTITKSGPGNLYYSAYLRTFSLEEDIRGTANEIFVRRRYFRLIPEDPTKINAGRPQGLGSRYADSVADIYRRVPMKAGEEVQSGDLIEVELFLESKNDYDYLAFEDLKPAGCEPVELRSGGRGENGLWSHMELRDQKVTFFLSQLPQGTRTLTYRLRAETPGRFHVLPTNGYAMYAPDIRTLSDEFQLGIRDRDQRVAAATELKVGRR